MTAWHKRLLWGAACSAVGMMAWYVVFWVLSPIPGGVFKALPDENAVVRVLRDTQLVTGVYRFPGLHEGQAMDGAYFEKHKAGPIGQIIYRREGVNPYTPTVFLLGLVHFFLASLLATGLLLLVVPALPTYRRRLLFLCLVGLLGAFTLDFADPIRWHQPWGFHVYAALFDAVNGLVSAAILAWFVDPSRQEAGPGSA
jgi:hypothetical protein